MKNNLAVLVIGALLVSGYVWAASEEASDRDEVRQAEQLDGSGGRRMDGSGGRSGSGGRGGHTGGTGPR